MTPTTAQIWRAAGTVRGLRQQSRRIMDIAKHLPVDDALAWLLLCARAMTVSEETSTEDFCRISDDYLELAAKHGLIVPVSVH